VPKKEERKMHPRLYIYLTQRNADMNEGRGPMVLDIALTTREAAQEYVGRKSGVMGVRGSWQELVRGGHWDIKEIPVYDTEPSEIDELREKALAKLTMAERVALGL
jgi:hypothetical protein